MREKCSEIVLSSLLSSLSPFLLVSSFFLGTKKVIYVLLPLIQYLMKAQGLSIWNYCDRPSRNIFRISPHGMSQIFSFWVNIFFYVKESFMSWRIFWDLTQLLFSMISSSPSAKLRTSDLTWFSLLNHYLFIWFCQFLLKNYCHKCSFFSLVLLLPLCYGDCLTWN